MTHGSPLHVVHIASGDLWAGAEVQLFTLAKALHSMAEVRVQIVLMNHGELEDRLIEHGINVQVFDESRLNSYQIFRHLIRFLKLNQPDIVHTHRLKENILGSLAGRFLHNIPGLRTVHGAPEHQTGAQSIPKRLIYALDRWVGHHLQNRIIAVSGDLASQLTAVFPAEKIHTIANGVDTDSLSDFTGRATASLKSSPTFKIGLVGRLVPVKRIDIFIQTARYLHEHYPEIPVSFHVYGDGPLAEELRGLSARLELNKRVTFEGHCSDIHQQMASLSAVLITSDHEGLPINLLEAMTLRVPVIAHAVGGIPEVLEEGKCGVLIRKNQPSAYAKAIADIYQANVDIVSLTQHAAEAIMLKYSSRANARSYLKVYQSMCAKTGGV